MIGIEIFDSGTTKARVKLTQGDSLIAEIGITKYAGSILTNIYGMLMSEGDIQSADSLITLITSVSQAAGHGAN